MRLYPKVSRLDYLGCSIGYEKNNDVNIKQNRFQQYTLLRKCQKHTILKFYRATQTPMLFIQIWKLDINKRTNEKNRNERNVFSQSG